MMTQGKRIREKVGGRGREEEVVKEEGESMV
jgi:hypothetical protein